MGSSAPVASLRTPKIKEKIEKLEKESVDMLMSQQYAKGLAKKREQEQLLKELESVKKKHNIPRKDRKKITGTDVQKILHQITGIPLSTVWARKLWSGRTTTKKSVAIRD